MLTKDAILERIDSLDREIEELEEESAKGYPDGILKLIKEKIGNLSDDRYRYSLQAKAGGIKVD